MVATLDTTGWLSPAQAAREVDLTPLRIRQLADAGRLRSCRTPLGRLIHSGDVARLAAERKARQRPAPPDDSPRAA